MFLDTSGLMSIHHHRDPWHKDARTFFALSGRKLTHGYVLAEFVALTQARGLSRPGVLLFLQSLVSHAEVGIVWITEGLHQDGMRLLATRLDKKYSLCDAISFVLMRHAGITDSLTTDHHFEQEGFRRLLK
jgi:uncharacterized protein